MYKRSKNYSKFGTIDIFEMVNENKMYYILYFILSKNLNKLK